MAQTDMLKRYLDAGIAFTKMTQERAEAIVRDLVGAGEVASDQAQSAVSDLVERSRENTERLLETVRTEIAAQVGNLGLATRADVDALRDEIAALRAGGSAGTTRTSAPVKKAAPTSGPGSSVELPATPSPAATAKKVAAKKATAKKAAPVKKAGTTRAVVPAKASAAKANPAKKA